MQQASLCEQKLVSKTGNLTLTLKGKDMSCLWHILHIIVCRKYIICRWLFVTCLWANIVSKTSIIYIMLCPFLPSSYFKTLYFIYCSLSLLILHPRRLSCPTQTQQKQWSQPAAPDHSVNGSAWAVASNVTTRKLRQERSPTPVTSVQ